jgi:hypothetical protein
MTEDEVKPERTQWCFLCVHAEKRAHEVPCRDCSILRRGDESFSKFVKLSNEETG